MEWRVWYPDHSVTVRRFEEWCALPDGVQGVVEYEDERAPNGTYLRRLVHASDWYYWHEGHVWGEVGGHDTGEFVDPPGDTCSSCRKRSGHTLPEDEWDRIYQEMIEARWPQ